MADEEDSLSTDSDDDEYIPEGDVCNSSGDEIKDEKELLNNEDKDNGRRRKAIQVPSRKRKGGIRLSTEQYETDESLSEEEREGDGGEIDGGEKEGEEREDTKKARLDELWSGFKSEVNLPRPLVTHQDKQKEINTIDRCNDVNVVTIKKTYDFAGEDVVVEEQVKASSQEAFEYEKTRLQTRPQTLPSNTITTSLPRHKLGAQRLLQSLTKKPKISTLDKSRLDWNKFKVTEGIQEELEFHNKDGYLEKKEFLQRTDMRQFEQERTERLKKRFKTTYS